MGLQWLLGCLRDFVLRDVELGCGAVMDGCVGAHSRGITEVCAHVTEAEVVSVIFRFVRDRIEPGDLHVCLGDNGLHRLNA